MGRPATLSRRRPGIDVHGGELAMPNTPPEVKRTSMIQTLDLEVRGCVTARRPLGLAGDALRQALTGQQ
jgi:hypothetical protein